MDVSHNGTKAKRQSSQLDAKQQISSNPISLILEAILIKRFALLASQYQLVQVIKRQMMIPFQYFYTPFGTYFVYSPPIQPYPQQEFNQEKPYDMNNNVEKSIEVKKEEISALKEQLIENKEVYIVQPKTRCNLTKEQKLRTKLIGKDDNSISQPKTSQISIEKKQKHSRQIDGRNANSNLLRMFFRRLEQVLQTSPQIIDRIITKNKIKISKAKFMEWFQINKEEYTNYIRLPCVKKLFICNRVNKSGKFQTKIMRILLNDFLRKEAYCFYLTSKKIKRTGMRHNYHSIRNILREIVEEQSDL